MVVLGADEVVLAATLTIVDGEQLGKDQAKLAAVLKLGMVPISEGTGSASGRSW